MGLVKSNESITAAEQEHGRRVTYSLNTLRADIRKAELSIIHKSGIFLKL